MKLEPEDVYTGALGWVPDWLGRADDDDVAVIVPLRRESDGHALVGVAIWHVAGVPDPPERLWPVVVARARRSFAAKHAADGIAPA